MAPPVRDTSEGTFRTCRRHVESEFAHDLETVMSTVDTTRPLLWLVPVFDSGLIPTEIITRTSYDNVRDHYINMLGRTRLVAGDHLVQIVGRSHMFIEGITDVENLTSGTPGSTRFCVLLVAGQGDGIVAECPWPWMPWDTIPMDDRPAELASERQLLATHDDFLAAIATGARVAHFFRPDGWVVEWGWPGPADGTVVVVHGNDAIDDRLRSELATVSITSVACVNRVVTPWYLYAELLWSYREGPGQTSSMRTAAFLPIYPDGRYIAQISLQI